jgi:hypothetical protein
MGCCYGFKLFPSAFESEYGLLRRLAHAAHEILASGVFSISRAEAV